MYLANQLYHKDSISLYKANLHATQDPHGYVILDLTLDTNGSLGFQTNVFPTEYPHPNVYSDIGDEAREIELSYPPRAQDG